MCFKVVVLPAPRKPERTIRRVGIVLYCIVLYWFEAAPPAAADKLVGRDRIQFGTLFIVFDDEEVAQKFFCHTIYRPYLIVPYLTFLDLSPKAELISSCIFACRKISAPVESSRNAL